MTQKSLSAEEVARKHGLPIYDPIQWYHIKRAMEEYASQLKEKEDVEKLAEKERFKRISRRRLNLIEECVATEVK